MAITDLDTGLIDRMLAGEATKEDRARFDLWSALQPSEANFANMIRTASHRPEDQIPVSIDAAWLQMLARINDSTVGEIEPARTRAQNQVRQVRARSTVRTIRPQPYGGSFYSGAFLSAAIALIVIAGAWLSRNWLPTFNVPERTYVTAPSQSTTIRIEDDIIMTLAPATTVRVRGASAAVDGEAYFQILPSSNRPFSVNTANAVVQVLGTKFLVRHYKDDSHSQVVVAEGKVGVRSDGQHARPGTQTVLTSNMLAVITDTGIVIDPKVSPDRYTGWMSGRLQFDGEPLSEVVKALERAYNVEIRLDDRHLASRPIVMAATIDRDSITDVLRLVTLTVNAHYRRVSPQSFVILPGRVGVPRAR